MIMSQSPNFIDLTVSSDAKPEQESKFFKKCKKNEEARSDRKIRWVQKRIATLAGIGSNGRI
jgi:hypothetical protein